MVEPQTPLGVLHKFTSYIYKVFLHLDMLWIGNMAPPLAWYPHELMVNFQECWGRDRPI